MPGKERLPANEGSKFNELLFEALRDRGASDDELDRVADGWMLARARELGVPSFHLLSELSYAWSVSIH